MGKQVRFFTLPNDEAAFWDFMFSIPGSYLLRWRSSLPEVHSLDLNVLKTDPDPELRNLLIGNSAFPLSSNDFRKINSKSYSEEKMDFIETGGLSYSIDSSRTSVIEFSRSFLRDDGKLVRGRLWAEFYTFEENKLVYKGDNFSHYYDTLANWIRKNFKRIKGIDGYFGKDALTWYKAGGTLFP